MSAGTSRFPWPAIGRRFVLMLAVATVLWGGLGSSAAHAQADCPSGDPDQNYDCPVGPVYILPGLGNVPWSNPQYYTTIRSGDLDGDGRAEVVARGPDGLRVWSFDSNRGLWLPVLTTDGTQVLTLGALSDARGWGTKSYYATLRLADIDGHPGQELVARSGQGIVVFKFTKGTLSGERFPTGSWEQVTTSGPFADADCFSDHTCWNTVDRTKGVLWFKTIRLGDLDGDGAAELVGLGADGIEAYTWNGSGWTALTGIPGALPTNILANETRLSYSLPLQLANVAGGASGNQVLIRTEAGMQVYQFRPGANGGTWTYLTSTVGNGGNPGGTAFQDALLIAPGLPASTYLTIQSADIDGDGVAELVGRAAEGFEVNPGQGLQMYRLQVDGENSYWVQVAANGPFPSSSGWSQPRYYTSIQLADVDGDKSHELLARGGGGIVVLKWTGNEWNQIVTNVPALADAPWADDPSYYATIQTADVDGNGTADLLARGQAGLRTWFFQSGTWTPPSRYGFPAFTGAECTAYEVLSASYNLPVKSTAPCTNFNQGGGIRGLYADPTIDSTGATLNAISQQLQGSCQTATGHDPPQYQTCTPAAGSTNPAWTAVVNQILKELWWATAVIGYFGSIQEMQEDLFTGENSEFPSLTDNLRLPSTGNQAAANYLTLFSSILQLVDVVVPDLTPLADTMAIVASVLPFFASPSDTTFTHTYDEIRAEIAELQQSAQTVVLAQKHHVLGDYGLLSTVGSLVGSLVWTVDQAGYLSTSRQAFTQWAYQGLLPTLWDMWEVTDCRNEGLTSCTPPPDGSYMQSYGPGGVSFSGLLPKQTPCLPVCGYQVCSTDCSWTPPPSAPVDTLFTPVSAQCIYRPGTGTAWVYGDPGANPPVPGCTLGIGPEIFQTEGGWKFHVTQLDPQSVVGAKIGEQSLVSRIGDAPLLHLEARATVAQRLRLDSARLTVRRLLGEARGAEELVKDAAGNEALPIVLTSRPAARATWQRAVFATRPGQTPEIEVSVEIDPRRRLQVFEIRLRVRVAGGAMAIPQLCIGAPPTTRLHLELRLDDGHYPPLTLAQTQDWECLTDADGVVSLWPAGNPVYGLDPAAAR